MSKPIDPKKMRDDLYSIQDTVDMMVWLLEEGKAPERVHNWLSNLKSAVSDLKKHCKVKAPTSESSKLTTEDLFTELKQPKINYK